MIAKTITILVGNSDNRLTQSDWTRFCRDVTQLVESKSLTKQFAAPSIGWHTFQNACWVITIDETLVAEFKKWITEIRKHYLQDSVAIVVGDTEFI